MGKERLCSKLYKWKVWYFVICDIFLHEEGKGREVGKGGFLFLPVIVSEEGKMRV